MLQKGCRQASKISLTLCLQNLFLGNVFWGIVGFFYLHTLLISRPMSSLLIVCLSPFTIFTHFQFTPTTVITSCFSKKVSRYTVNRTGQRNKSRNGISRDYKRTHFCSSFIIKVTHNTSLCHKIMICIKYTCCICSGKGPSEFSIITDGIGPHLLLVRLRTVSLACLVFCVWA